MIDLYYGDCFASNALPALSDKSIDVILTDPPFDKRTHRAAAESGDWKKGKRSIKRALPFPPLTDEQIRILAAHFVRVCKGWILIFVPERKFELWASSIEKEGGSFRRLGAGVRKNPRPQMLGDRPALGVDPILIAWAGQGASRWNGRGRAAKWDAPAARWDTGKKNVHPAQKPLALMRALVEDFTQPGDLICDPFAGSGSTAIACKELGRRFVGWEISDVFYARACTRILNASGLGQPVTPGSPVG